MAAAVLPGDHETTIDEGGNRRLTLGAAIICVNPELIVERGSISVIDLATDI